MKTADLEALSFSDLYIMRNECISRGSILSDPSQKQKYVNLHIAINAEINKRLGQFIK